MPGDCGFCGTTAGKPVSDSLISTLFINMSPFPSDLIGRCCLPEDFINSIPSQETPRRLTDNALEEIHHSHRGLGLHSNGLTPPSMNTCHQHQALCSLSCVTCPDPEHSMPQLVSNPPSTVPPALSKAYIFSCHNALEFKCRGQGFQPDLFITLLRTWPLVYNIYLTVLGTLTT